MLNQTTEVLRRKPFAAWVLITTLLLTSLVWACSGSDPDPATDPGGDASTNEPTTESGTSTNPDDKEDGATNNNTDATTATDAKVDGASSSSGGDATDPNFKVAFIGDTGTGSDFKSVLQLIKKEGAQLVMVQGDLNYTTLGPATTWFKVIDDEINSTFPGSPATVTIPYFIAKGNHDVDWNGYGSGLKTRMTQWGVASENGDPTTKNYSVVYKGLKVVMVNDTETSNPTRADYVNARLTGDTHFWKICSWHKNQRNANVGPKSDEMGWAIYENCRNNGAIVAQAHSHTYSRSKTLTNDAMQTVDTTAGCSDPFSLCVGAGKHFFFDSSLGGEDTRSLNATAAALTHWGSTFTGGFGALFITFNVGNDPNKAEAYFKTTGDIIVDPPASSGKTTFTITRTP